MTLNLVWFLYMVQAGVTTPPATGGQIDKITLGYKQGGVTAVPILGGKW